MVKASIVIPCFLNEENIPITCEKLVQLERTLKPEVEFEYIMIDDGSEDGTFQALLNFKNQLPDQVKVIKLAKNVGPYNALLAGVGLAKGNCIVVMAADLQNPPETVPLMIDLWKAGSAIVVATRITQTKKRMSTLVANIYYTVIRRWAIPKLPHGGADFCLFDRSLRDGLLSQAVWGTDTLLALFLLRRSVATVGYQHRPRQVGASGWTVRKKVDLFLNTFHWLFPRLETRIKQTFALSILNIVLIGFVLVCSSMAYANWQRVVIVGLMMMVLGAAAVTGLIIYQKENSDMARYQFEIESIV